MGCVEPVGVMAGGVVGAVGTNGVVGAVGDVGVVGGVAAFHGAFCAQTGGVRSARAATPRAITHTREGRTDGRTDVQSVA